MRNILQAIRSTPFRIDSHGGHIWRIRWWNTYSDPVTGQPRWGWCAWWGARVMALDHCLLDLIRRRVP